MGSRRWQLGDALAAVAVVYTDDVPWNHASFAWDGLLIDGVLAPYHEVLVNRAHGVPERRAPRMS